MNRSFQWTEEDSIRALGLRHDLPSDDEFVELIGQWTGVDVSKQMVVDMTGDGESIKSIGYMLIYYKKSFFLAANRNNFEHLKTLSYESGLNETQHKKLVENIMPYIQEKIHQKIDKQKKLELQQSFENLPKLPIKSTKSYDIMGCLKSICWDWCSSDI